MRTTLLVEGNDQLQRFFSINLYTWVGCDVHPVREAKLLFEKVSDQTELIITRYKSGTEQSARAITEYLQDKKLNIPVIVIGDDKQEISDVTHIKSSLDIKELIQNCAKSLNVTAKDMAELEVPEYFPIPLQFFHCLKYSVVNVYCHKFITNAEGEELETYDLIYAPFSDFDSAEISKLASEGQYNLFVKKEDRLKFVTNLTQELISVIEMKELNSNEQISAMEMNQNLLQLKITRMGITEETVKLAKHNLKNMIATTKRTPILLRLLKRLLDNKAGYLFKHTQVLMMISRHIMQNIDWGTPEQIEKLQFISFFHDIVLETDEMAQISSEKELKASKLSEEEKNIVKKHAQLAATLVSKYPKAPMGSELIIKQHHGVPHGMGFAETYTANLSPMAIVFILAEDFTHEVLRSGLEFDIESKINQMRQKYSTQRFQKIIDVLEEITLT